MKDLSKEISEINKKHWGMLTERNLRKYNLFYELYINGMKELIIKYSTNALPSNDEIKQAIHEISKESTAPDKETPDWMEVDIERGMKWMHKRLTGKELVIKP